MKNTHIAFRRLAFLLLAVAMIATVIGACTPEKKQSSSSSSQNEEGSMLTDPDQSEDPLASGADGSADGTSEGANSTGGGNKTSNASNQSGQSNTTGSTTSTGSQTGTSSGATDKPVVTKGYDFTVVSQLLPAKAASDNTLFEKLFFKRVAEVEKELGCKIKVINTLVISPSVLAPMIQAGKKVGDVIEMQLDGMPSLISAGYLKPWNDVPGINVNDEKYTAGYTKLAEMGGKNWGLQFMNPPELRYCVVMNKTLLKANGIDADGIYDLVNKKTWGFDTFRDYAIRTTKVVNGVTQSYGMGGRPDYVIEQLLAANNASLVTVDKSGKGTPTYTSSAVAKTLSFFNKLVNEDKVFLSKAGMEKQTTYQTSIPEYFDEFIKGKIAFLFEDSWVLNQQIKPRVKNFDFGMIPIPLGWDSTKYVSPASHARVFTVTSTNTGDNLAITAKIFNELSKPPSGYTGKDWWMEDVQLDYFQKTDSKSLPMYKMLLDNSMWDVGMGVDSFIDGFMRQAVLGPIFWKTSNSTDSALESIKGVYDKAIKDTIK